MKTKAFSTNGVRTVIELELKQRIRSRRWIIALIAWFVGIGVITGLMLWAVLKVFNPSSYLRDGWGQSAGPLVFGLITLFLLGMGLVIAPTFTATSINGDRATGTLAILQVTRLSAVEIAAGKLVAAWLTSLTFLVTALPFIGVAMVIGNISIWQVAVCFLAVFVEVAVVCSFGLGLSAIISRTAGSVVLTYLSVIALTIIPLIVAACLAPFLSFRGTVRTYEVEDYDSNRHYTQADCSWQESTRDIYHTQILVWLFAVNPFVVISDAAPLPPSAENDLDSYLSQTPDPLAGIRYSIRALARSQELETDVCYYQVNENMDSITYDKQGNMVLKDSLGNRIDYTSPVKNYPLQAGPPIWPWGLAFHLILGGLFFWLAVRRLTVPYSNLPKGTRVA